MTMQKQDIYAYLKMKNIRHEIIEHEAVYNMEEASKLELPPLPTTLFLCSLLFRERKPMRAIWL